MRIAITAATMILAACGSTDDAAPSAPEQSTDVQQTSTPTNSGPAIRKVTDAELAIALGSECPTVTKSQYKGKTDDQVFYAVQCGSRETLLGIKFDGSTKGFPCELAEQMDTPCWKPWPENN